MWFCWKCNHRHNFCFSRDYNKSNFKYIFLSENFPCNCISRILFLFVVWFGFHHKIRLEIKISFFKLFLLQLIVGSKRSHLFYRHKCCLTRSHSIQFLSFHFSSSPQISSTTWPNKMKIIHLRRNACMHHLKIFKN